MSDIEIKYKNLKKKYLEIKKNICNNELIWSEPMLNNKFESLKKIIGNPNNVSKTFDGELNYVIWQLRLNGETKLGHFKGLDYIKLSNYKALKKHQNSRKLVI